MKIFLSHSSADRDYVGPIAEMLGRDSCAYAEISFEEGEKNLAEIFREMDKCSIFVVFISSTALDSPWVQTELTMAEERLQNDSHKFSQVFPIIIDPTVHHDDPRIPPYMKAGFDSYNLRPIDNNLVAYRKIILQQQKLLFLNNIPVMRPCFYGRHAEIGEFKKNFDSGNGSQCIVASGIPGIGRYSYLINCLKSAELIEPYYAPPIISINTVETIEDLLVKFSSIGYGDYSIEKVASLKDIDTKVEALIEVLHKIQEYKDRVVVYDDNCLVNRNGEIVWWLKKAFSSPKVRPEITLLIAAARRINPAYSRKNMQWLFSVELATLPEPEWFGLMRVYAKQISFDLPREEIEWFSSIITGYPPQVLYAVDLMKDYSIETVKKESYKIVNSFSSRISTFLDEAIPEELQTPARGLLAFLSTYGIVPIDMLNIVLERNKAYEDTFRLLRALTVCKNIGISSESVQVNPVIADYIQRSKYELPSDINEVLHDRLEMIEAAVESGESTLGEDSEEIKYYLKTQIKKDAPIPTRFMYSTLYMSSIFDLYNDGKYAKVISLTKALKESGAFDRYDIEIQDQIQRYYCLSLARERDSASFYSEVDYFKPKHKYDSQVEYNFLLGFMCRQEAKYDKALDYFFKVLEEYSEHKAAKREIVSVYQGLEDYERAYDFAKSNYEDVPDNMFYIIPYFEVLIRRKRHRTAEDNKQIEEIVNSVIANHRLKKDVTYFEVLGQYYAFIESDKERAISILNAGIESHPDSTYLYKYLFDCAELFEDDTIMRNAVEQLEKLKSQNRAVRVVTAVRKCRLDAYEGRPYDIICRNVDGIKGFNQAAKDKLKNQVKTICSKTKKKKPSG